MILKTKKMYSEESISNSRVHDFNEEFHSLSQAGWKMYKAWLVLIYMQNGNFIDKAIEDVMQKPNTFFKPSSYYK